MARHVACHARVLCTAQNARRRVANPQREHFGKSAYRRIRVASDFKSAKLEIAGAPNEGLSRNLRGVRTMSNRFTQFILIAMALGIVMGAAIFNFLPDNRAEIASSVNLIAMLFLRLIKMIIAPLVFATLVGGIAHMGTGSKLGRVFAKTMGWFVSASFVSLLL